MGWVLFSSQELSHPPPFSLQLTRACETRGERSGLQGLGGAGSSATGDVVCLPHTRARGWALQLGGWAWAGSAQRVAVSEAGPQRAWGIRACPACHLGLRSSYHTGDARAEWTMCHLRGTGSEEEEGGMRGTSWTSLARWVGVFKGYFFLTTNYKK